MSYITVTVVLSKQVESTRLHQSDNGMATNNLVCTFYIISPVPWPWSRWAISQSPRLRTQWRPKLEWKLGSRRKRRSTGFRGTLYRCSSWRGRSSLEPRPPSSAGLRFPCSAPRTSTKPSSRGRLSSCCLASSSSWGLWQFAVTRAYLSTQCVGGADVVSCTPSFAGCIAQTICPDPISNTSSP